MGLQNNLVTGTELDQTEHSSRISLQQLSYYAVCGLTGVLSGALGVALTIGFIILVQLFFFPLEIFWPNAIIFSIFAVSFGAVFSWLLNKVIKFTLSIFDESNQLKVILIFSTLTGLLQIFLFFAV